VYAVNQRRENPDVAGLPAEVQLEFGLRAVAGIQRLLLMGSGPRHGRGSLTSKLVHLGVVQHLLPQA